jgi:hypothetical protein
LLTSLSLYAILQGALNGMLSYPLFFALRDCFMGGAAHSTATPNLQPMARISSLLNQNNGLYHKYFRDVSLLATFVDK